MDEATARENTAELPEIRPNPWRWIAYAYGAGLPARHRSWVFADTTGRTWAARHILRSLLQMSPAVLAVLIFLPGPLWIRAMAGFGGLVMGCVYSIGYMVETTEHRLVKAGYLVGTGELTRARRVSEQRSDGTARRRQRMFDRMDQRGQRR